MNTDTRGLQCDLVLRSMDGFLDGALADAAEMQKHIAICDSCRHEAARRSSLNSRLKLAARHEEAGPHLLAGIRNVVWEYEAQKRQRMQWMTRLSAVAAVLVMAFGGWIAYELGHLRLTTESQEAYVSSLLHKVSHTFGIGLGDHVHCSVFRKYPKNPLPFEQVAKEIGPEYTELPAIVREQAPQGMQLVKAHQCGYRGRRFVHLIVRGEGKLASLVIARKKDGESFARDQIRSLLTTPDEIPIYQAAAQRFEVAAFETGEHIVYFISDLPRQQNMKLLIAMAPSLKTALDRPKA